jgi:small subunit ribosomal protein S5
LAKGRRRQEEELGPSFEERVIFINRVTKVVKGGKNMSFTALVAVGDKAGKIGIGLGKAREVATAIQKGNDVAKRVMKNYPLSDGGRTLPHPVDAIFRSTRVILKPAAPGTGVIAGGAVRAILEAAGIKDAITKVLGSRTAVNVAYCTVKALDEMEDVAMIAHRRNIPVERLKTK